MILLLYNNYFICIIKYLNLNYISTKPTLIFKTENEYNINNKYII